MIRVKECLIDNENYAKYIPYPATENKVLDESLDYANILFLATDIKEPFRPMTPVKLTMSENYALYDLTGDRQNFYILIKDKVTENVQYHKYTHELTLMEETKLLERILIGGKTVTQPFIKNYLELQANMPFYAYRQGNDLSSSVIEPTQYISPLKFNTVLNLETNIEKIITQADTTSRQLKGVITCPNGEQILFLDYKTTINSLQISQIGTYIIEYTIPILAGFNIPVEVRFYFTSVEPNQAKDDYSLTEVINIVLNTCETKLKIPNGESPSVNEIIETPRFTFNQTQADEYSTIISPEFSFSNQMSLWEVFSQIASYVHAIPRIRNKVLYFDKLGEIKESDLRFDRYLINEKTFDMEQYASGIISNVSNLINFDADGTSVEPRYNYMTLRSETGNAYITEDNMIIKTQYPIGKLLKVECGVLSDENNTLVGDITNFVYEESEYQALSSYIPTYPNSKSYAIYYTIGEKNIKGLTFKQEALISAFKNYAIQNILSAKTGIPMSILDKIFPTDEDKFVLQNLMFRVTYQPYIETQLKQIKQTTDDLVFKSDLAYNQGSNSINSQAYGENLKGVIARLGNLEIVRTYIFKHLLDIPNVGELIITKEGDQYYISNMIIEYYKDFIKCQIGFSKDFNRWNEYVGIKNNIRFYEIAKNQAVDRYVFLEDFCLIGSSIQNQTSANLTITSDAVELFAKQLQNQEIDINDKNIGFVNVNTYDKSEELIAGARLPVSSLGIGNTLYFSFDYEDNYSAGNQIILRNKIRIQNQIRYVDIYGEVHYLKAWFSTGQPDDNQFSILKTFGDSLPFSGGAIPNNPKLATNRFVDIQKDNKERIKFIYLIHFITNDKNVVLGNALTTTNPLVSTETTNFKVYVSPNRIPKFIDEIDTSGMTLIGNIPVANVNAPLWIELGNLDSPVDGKAWLITNTDSNGKQRLVIGKNQDVSKLTGNTLVNFYYTHQTGLFN